MFNFCYHIKKTSFYHKYTIYPFGKGIKGNPFIIRFKTKEVLLYTPFFNLFYCIKGNPFIIRFKTEASYDLELLYDFKY